MRWIGAQRTRQVVLRLAEPPLVQQHGGTAELGIRSLRRRVHAVALVDSSFRQRGQAGGQLRGFGRLLLRRLALSRRALAQRVSISRASRSVSGAVTGGASTRPDG